MRRSRPVHAGIAAAMALVAPFWLFPAQAPAQGIAVSLNGNGLPLDPAPMERAGRVFVPLRGVFERMGASVVYANGVINSTRGATTVSLRIGSTQATVNGRTEMIDVAPFIVGASTFIPLRFVAQSFGANVDWNGANRAVIITMPHHPPPLPPEPPPQPPPQPPPYYPPVPPPVSVVHLRMQQPAPGAMTSNRFVTISTQFSHRVEPGSVRVWLDGNDITSRVDRSATNIAYSPPAPLSFGGHTLRVTGRDQSGVRFDHSWSFSVGGAPPPPPTSPVHLVAQQPAPGSTTMNRFALISAEFSRRVDADSVRVLLDGNNVTGRVGKSETQFSYKPPAPLDTGSHTVRVTGRGNGGQSFDRSWSFTVRGAPQPGMNLTITEPGDNDVVGWNFLVRGNTRGGAKVRVTAGPSASAMNQFNGDTVAGPQGNFRVNVTMRPMPGQGAVTVRIVATDPDTSQTAQKTLYLRIGNQ